MNDITYSGIGRRPYILWGRITSTELARSAVYIEKRHRCIIAIGTMKMSRAQVHMRRYLDRLLGRYRLTLEAP